MSAPSQQEEQSSSNQPQGSEEDNTQLQQSSSAQVIVPPESSMVISTPGQQASASTTSSVPEKTEWSETRAGQKERQQQQQYQQPQQPQQQQQQYREIPSNFQPSRIMGGQQQQPTNVNNQYYQPSPAYLQFQQPSNRMGGQQDEQRGGQQQQQQQQPPRPPTIETTYQSDRGGQQGQQDQQRRRQQEQQQEDYSALEAKYVPPRAVYRSGTGQRIDELCKKNFSSFNVGFSFFQTSGLQKTGRWVVPRYVSVYLLLAGGGLDMTYAEFVHPQTDIHVYTIMGGYNIMVPPGVRIEAFGGSACGAIQKTQDEIEPILPQSPLVVLHSYVMMGGSTISVNRPAQMVHVITADE